MNELAIWVGALLLAFLLSETEPLDVSKLRGGGRSANRPASSSRRIRSEVLGKQVMFLYTDEINAILVDQTMTEATFITHGAPLL